MGSTSTFLPDAFAAAIRPNTKIIYGETLGNPDITVFPFAQVSAIAREYHIPLMIDNTFATPYLQRPLELGADLGLLQEAADGGLVAVPVPAEDPQRDLPVHLEVPGAEEDARGVAGELVPDLVTAASALGDLQEQESQVPPVVRIP